MIKKKKQKTTFPPSAALRDLEEEVPHEMSKAVTENPRVPVPGSDLALHEGEILGVSAACTILNTHFLFNPRNNTAIGFILFYPGSGTGELCPG